MTKLIFLTLSMYFLTSCNSQEPSKEKVIKGKEITILRVDESSLSIHDRKFLIKVDSICAKVDLDKDLMIYQFDTSILQKEIKSELLYTVYHNRSKEIFKIASQGSNDYQKLNYTFYFLSGKLIKTETQNLESNPFTSIVYFSGEKALFPKEFDEATVNQMKKQAELIYQYLYNKL